MDLKVLTILFGFFHFFSFSFSSFPTNCFLIASNSPSNSSSSFYSSILFFLTSNLILLNFSFRISFHLSRLLTSRWSTEFGMPQSLHCLLIAFLFNISMDFTSNIFLLQYQKSSLIVVEFSTHSTNLFSINSGLEFASNENYAI